MHTIKQLVSLLLFYLLLIVAIGQYVGLLALCTHVRPTVEALLTLFAATKKNPNNNNKTKTKTKQNKTKKAIKTQCIYVGCVNAASYQSKNLSANKLLITLLCRAPQPKQFERRCINL